MKNKIKTIALGALCASLAFVSFNASAALISFDDDQRLQDGTVWYGGTGGTLGGTGIDFHSILGVDTPSNDGNSLVCIRCELNFQTGNNITEGQTTGIWTFAGGGSLVITGSVETQGGDLIADGTLASGSFTEALVFGGGSTLTLSGLGVDEKNQGLIEYFGLGPDFTFASTQIALGTVDFYPCNGITPSTPSECGGFSGTVTNADFDNMAVPVPAAVWLFGSGLLGLVGIARRRKA